MTTKPQSTISFNTESFLFEVLKTLLDKGDISMYAFVKHSPETDVTKPHIHLYFEPSRRIDCYSFRRNFIEPVNGDAPLGCLPLCSSKFGDWLLYALHDDAYLASKMLFRVEHYKLSDVVSSEGLDFLRQQYFSARESLPINRFRVVSGLLDDGASWGDLLRSGVVPPSQLLFWRDYYAHYKPKNKLKEKGGITM